MNDSAKGQDNQQVQDKDELKKKREEHQLEIRRQQRLEEFNKHRKIDNRPQAASNSHQSLINQNLISQNQIFINSQSGFAHNNEALKEHIDNCLKKTYSIQDFEILKSAVIDKDVMMQHFGVIGLRKILSVEDGPPIQAVIDANLIPRLIELIKQEEHPHLQLEAAWALTNVASGSSQQTQAIIDKGGIPLFVKLLKSNHQDIAEQAIWALGNIAGDCAIYRDMILKCEALDPLIKIIESSNNRQTIKHGTWALSNLCRGRPLPEFEKVKKAIPTLAKVIKEETDSEVLTDACWAISYLSDGDEDRIQMVLDTEVVPTLIRLLDHPYLSVLIPSLRTLGNIVTGSDDQTNEVVNKGALEKFYNLLNHEKRAVRRECCWTLSNITAGNAEQISKIIQNNLFVEKLIQLIQTDLTEIKREAAWVLSNATSQGSPQDIIKLVQMGILEVFVDLLKSEDFKTVAVVLEAINNILNTGKKYFSQSDDSDINETTKQTNQFAEILEKLQAVQIIEKLQYHPSEDIYQKSLKILETHFELDNVFDN